MLRFLFFLRFANAVSFVRCGGDSGSHAVRRLRHKCSVSEWWFAWNESVLRSSVPWWCRVRDTSFDRRVITRSLAIHISDCRQEARRWRHFSPERPLFDDLRRDFLAVSPVVVVLLLLLGCLNVTLYKKIMNLNKSSSPKIIVFIYLLFSPRSPGQLHLDACLSFTVPTSPCQISHIQGDLLNVLTLIFWLNFAFINILFFKFECIQNLTKQMGLSTLKKSPRIFPYFK